MAALASCGERMRLHIGKAIQIRDTYQNKLYACGRFPDGNTQRSLDPTELALVHNAWMNDVVAWMDPECLNRYNALLRENEQRQKGKGKGRRGKGLGKTKGKDQGKSKGKDHGKSKGKHQGKSKGDAKGGAGKAARAFIGPGQQAQQLKKQRFNKVISDLAKNKAWFMSFVCHPCLSTADSVLKLLRRLIAAQQGPEYERMRAVSAKKTSELVGLKRKRDAARLRLRKGRGQHDRGEQTKLAKLYRSGVLGKEQEQAELAFGDRKLPSLGDLVGPPMGE